MGGLPFDVNIIRPRSVVDNSLFINSHSCINAFYNRVMPLFLGYGNIRQTMPLQMKWHGSINYAA